MSNQNDPRSADIPYYPPGEDLAHRLIELLPQVDARLASLDQASFQPGPARQLLAGYGLEPQTAGAATFAWSEVLQPAATLLVYCPDPTASLNLWASLEAMRAWQAALSLFPVSFKFLSGPLDDTALEALSDRLQASAIIYAAGSYRQGRPLLCQGLKGLLQVELEISGPGQNVPVAYSELTLSPAWQLAQALASIKSAGQQVRLAGFEDELTPLPPVESRRLSDSAAEFTGYLADLRQDHRLAEFIFEMQDHHALQTLCQVPALNLAALSAGDFEAGYQQVPDQARARLEFLLVPDQRPATVLDRLRRHLDELGFRDVVVRPRPGAYPAARTPLTDPFTVGALAAAHHAAGRAPLLLPLSPWPGPLAWLVDHAPGAPAICAGLDGSLPGDVYSHLKFMARLVIEAARLHPAPAGPDA